MAQDIKVETLGGLTCEPTGGINHRKIKVALLDWFETDGVKAPKPLCDSVEANEATTFAEMATISEDHVFKTGYGFMTIEAIQETVDIESAPIGEKRRKLFENKSNIQVAGSNADLLGFSRWIKNKDVVVLLPETESGNYRQIGSEAYAAMIEVTGKIEATVEGGNTQSYVVSDKQVFQAPIYAGTVTDMPAQA